MNPQLKQTTTHQSTLREKQNALRKDIRKKRRQLSVFEQRCAEIQLTHRLLNIASFKHAQHVGIYLHAFGEIQTHRIIQLCFKLHKKVYLPKINPMNQTLSWVNINHQQYVNRRFLKHRLGMLEPTSRHVTNIKHLNLLLLPLVLCDQLGTRIGMGGGFYDRTLMHTKSTPFRLGIAHDFQYIDAIVDKQKWDQSLDALLTPMHYYAFKRVK